jgi:4-hydroxy-4-methyl-2-oxoglutarate aldolase
MPAPDLSKTLYTAVLSDVLDSLGYHHQAMLSFVRPIDPDIPLFGRVRTGLFEPRDGERPGEHPYDIEIALIDDLKPGDVAVLACGGPTEIIAPWGELLTTASRARGAVGAVTDGLVRDARIITRMRFPVFHGGFRPLDSKGRGKMGARDTEVVCGGVACRSGDLVFGDQDGVVVIPQAISEQVIARAIEKIDSENITRTELQGGATLAEVFARHGTL